MGQGRGQLDPGHVKGRLEELSPEEKEQPNLQRTRKETAAVYRGSYLK
jgi:hypothetical protein